MKKRTFILMLLIFLGLGSAIGAAAQCTFNGSIVSGDTTHANALNTSGVNSTVLAPQVCPGIFNTANPVHYDRYNFANLNATATDYEVTADATGCTAGQLGATYLFGTAYLGSFDTGDLCSNYLASMGMGNTDSGLYSFTVPAGMLFSLIVEEFDPNAACATYTLTVTPCPDVAPSPSPTPAGSITGTVTYGNAIGAPTTRPVSNVLVSGAGSTNVSTTTAFPTGTYTLTGFGTGSYTITPTKSGGINSITSFDAARIAQHASGGTPLTGNQLVVADVSGNGSVSSFDAAQVAKYVVTAPPFGTTGNWIFSPVSNFHAAVSSVVTGEDYSALLMGEVSGNWTDSGSRSFDNFGPAKSTAVSAPQVTAPAGRDVVIPVTIDGAAYKDVIAYEFDLRYDPAVIQPQKNAVELTGTASHELSAEANAIGEGVLRVAVYGAKALDSDGVLLNLRFTAVGKPGSVSPLVWERFMLNEDEGLTTTTDGQVQISGVVSNQAEISGRLLTAFGQGIPGARVKLTDVTGKTRAKMTVSNGFGYFQFGGLAAGEAYTINVESRGWRFAPVTVSATDQPVNTDLIAR